jgi:hypothetical protein
LPTGFLRRLSWLGRDAWSRAEGLLARLRAS